MPPSPSSFRRSPGRGGRVESTHKRGRSFDSGLPRKAKDDDLALFNEMQSKERDNFLLHNSDDFEDSISKLRYFSSAADFKLGINILDRGESSNLLNTDGEKDDYNWLFTPPDTPLFRSLDDEECQPVNLLPRGRPRSQPISVPRSSTSEVTHRTSRSSASPHRLSPSPRSSGGLIQSRGRPSSAPRSSPPPVLRPASPSRQPSTPPSKPSTPAPRPSTPTLRRMSTGSSGMPSTSGRRGTSPVQANRGNSSSPKLREWQASLDGFSADAPPNLRTSLSDRPTSYARGSSPSPRRDTSPKFGRHSMSPTASRSPSSSHSHERDNLSTYSRRSIASSGDGDVDSLHSVTVGKTGILAGRKNGAILNNKTMTLSKKQSRTVSASSAPKRSFDSALRQMDHHRTPQNMFRPLLSSVPTTTFYAGKGSSMQRPMFSRNSSLTTSSNASSEHGAGIAPDIEVSDHEHNDLAGESERTRDINIQEEMFIFDKVDEINEEDCHEIWTGKPGTNDQEVEKGMPNKIDRNLTSNLDNAVNATALDTNACGDHSVLGSYERKTTCSKCGNRFSVHAIYGGTDFCEECTRKAMFFTSGDPGTSATGNQNEAQQSEMSMKIDTLFSAVPINTNLPTLPKKNSDGVVLDKYEIKNGCDPGCAPGTFPLQLINQSEPHLSDQQLNRLQQVNTTQSSCENESQQYQHMAPPNIRVDNPEGTGISVLLQKSSTSKWPFVQGRNISATNILCTEPSYARDSKNAMKHSIGQDNASVSSVDMVPLKQTDDHLLRQLSSNRCEVDKMANDVATKAQTDSFICGHLSTFQIKSRTEESFSGSTEVVEYETFRETMLGSEEQHNSLEIANVHSTPSLSVGLAADVDMSDHAGNCLTMNTSDSQLLSHPCSNPLRGISVADNLNAEDCTSRVSAEEDLSENIDRSIQDLEVTNEIQACAVSLENHALNSTTSFGDRDDDMQSSAMIVELESDKICSREIESECMPSENPSNIEVFHEHSISASKNDVLDSSLLSDILDHVCSDHEERTVTIEGPGGPTSRSLTLEEATDTILFCSSIIHGLAYKAVNIGMEKELMLMEGSRPTITLLGNSISKQKEPRKSSDKSTPKSHKFRRKRVEANTKATELGDDTVKAAEPRPTCEEDIPNKPDSLKPQKLESKCNCTVM